MKITIVHQAALGDTLLLVPLIEVLYERFGGKEEGTHITFVTRANIGQMLTMRGKVDAYASADDAAHTAWFSKPESAEWPNSRPEWAECDLLISAVSDGKDAWFANASLAMKQKYGDKAGEKIYCFQSKPPPDFAEHVTVFHRRQLEELALKEPKTGLPIRNPDGAIIIHPGSGSEKKCWPRAYYIQLGHDLQRNGIIPNFILGEAEMEHWSRDALEELQNTFPCRWHLGLFELSEKIERARVYLGNDSGVSHLAAMLGVPTIAIFGPSDDVQWRPVGPQVSVLRPPAEAGNDLTKLEVAPVLVEVFRYALMGKMEWK